MCFSIPYMHRHVRPAARPGEESILLGLRVSHTTAAPFFCKQFHIRACWYLAAFDLDATIDSQSFHPMFLLLKMRYESISNVCICGHIIFLVVKLCSRQYIFRYRKQCLKRKIHQFWSTAEKNSELCPVHPDSSTLTVSWCKCLLNAQG